MTRWLRLLLCLALPLSAAAQDEFWCWDADVVEVVAHGDMVRIYHLAALLNCCPEPITFDVHIGDATSTEVLAHAGVGQAKAVVVGATDPEPHPLSLGTFYDARVLSHDGRVSKPFTGGSSVSGPRPSRKSAEVQRLMSIGTGKRRAQCGDTQ